MISHSIFEVHLAYKKKNTFIFLKFVEKNQYLIMLYSVDHNFSILI